MNQAMKNEPTDVRDFAAAALRERYAHRDRVRSLAGRASLSILLLATFVLLVWVSNTLMFDSSAPFGLIMPGAIGVDICLGALFAIAVWDVLVGRGDV